MSEHDEPAEERLLFGELIFAYPRSEALADGVLVDVSAMAREAGIKFPVAVTQALWQERILADERLEELGQDTEGRLWDTVWMLRLAIARCEASTVEFEVHYLNRDGVLEGQRSRAVCGPDDDGSPCITLLLPHED